MCTPCHLDSAYVFATYILVLYCKKLALFLHYFSVLKFTQTQNIMDRYRAEFWRKDLSDVAFFRTVACALWASFGMVVPVRFCFLLVFLKSRYCSGKFKIAHFPPTRACVFMADVYVLSSYLPRTTTLKRLCIKGVRVLLPPVPCETGDVREFLQNVRDFFCTRDAGLLRDRQSREADDSESRRKRRSASEYPRSFRFSKLSLSHLERYAGFESRDRAP